MWYDCQLDNSPQENNMTQKLIAIIGQCMAVINTKRPYHIVKKI